MMFSQTANVSNGTTPQLTRNFSPSSDRGNGRRLEQEVGAFGRIFSRAYVTPQIYFTINLYFVRMFV